MSRLKQVNNEITFLLTVIDVFSKRAWCVPLKSKSAAALVTAFRELLSNSNNRAPTTLQTDKGTEFLNRPLQRLLKEYGVHHFTTHNEDTKASIVERYNRTLKTRMWRYFTKNQTLPYVDVLQDFVRSYNDTYQISVQLERRVPLHLHAHLLGDPIVREFHASTFFSIERPNERTGTVVIAVVDVPVRIQAVAVCDSQSGVSNVVPVVRVMYFGEAAFPFPGQTYTSW